MESSRKRPHVDEDDPAVTKKRLLSTPNGSPLINGNGPDQVEPHNDYDLELFRKEAIFRRMKHYCRENERSKQRLEELERRKNTCEAGLAAISACWAQLVETIREFVKPEDVPDVTVTPQDLLGLTCTQDVFAKVLDTSMAATRTLVTNFVQSDRSSISPSNTTSEDCHKIQAECNSLRSQLHLIESRLKDSVDETEKLREDLSNAEIQVDRMRSGSVQSIRTRHSPEQIETKKPDDATPPPPEQPSPTIMSPAPPKSIEPLTMSDPEVQVLIEQHKRRESELSKQIAHMRSTKVAMEQAMPSYSATQLHSIPQYHALFNHASNLEGTLSYLQDQNTYLHVEFKALKDARSDWEAQHLATLNQTVQEYKAIVARRDADNTRLRDQREQQAAELHERKQLDKVKLGSPQELKALADSRSERIAVLESEIRRLKAHMAANDGAEDLMVFLFGPDHPKSDYIHSLEARLQSMQTQLDSYKQALEPLETERPGVAELVEREAAISQRLTNAINELEKYQSIYGDPATLAPDVAKLAAQLQRKEEEVKRLELVNRQRAEAETSLYAEMDKISTAWEALDRQVKSKAFDLAGFEEKISKSVVERAKSENKFFAAMREKEAIEAERKSLVRLSERQAKAIEKLVETEKNLSQQVSAFERDYLLKSVSEEKHRPLAEQLAGQVADLTNQLHDIRSRLITAEKDRDAAIEKHITERHELEQKNASLTKDVGRQAKQIQALSTRPVDPQGDSSEEQARLWSLLKCSICKQKFRDRVITRCSHTFCKECVDSRISTRQRKCPACNLPFAQTDVQPLFFQ